MGYVLNTCPVELTCDMAEVYHIYDIKQLPARTAAALVQGLGQDSRVKRKLSGMPVSFQELMLVRIYDSVHWLCWSRSKAAQQGGDPPERLEDRIFGREADNDLDAFDSPEDFEAARERLIGGADNG